MRINYPTVTVCPQQAEDPRKVEKLLKQLLPNTNDTKEFDEFIRAIPNFSYGSKGLKAVILSENNQYQIEELQYIDLRALAFKIAKTCPDVFKNCRHKGRAVDCCSSFMPTFTEHGFCYAFNAKAIGTPREE